MLNLRTQAFAQLCAVRSSFGAQKTCYGLTVATPSDGVVCKVKSWLSQMMSVTRITLNVF
jgi:hypothetical protein